MFFNVEHFCICAKLHSAIHSARLFFSFSPRQSRWNNHMFHLKCTMSMFYLTFQKKKNILIFFFLQFLSASNFVAKLAPNSAPSHHSMLSLLLENNLAHILLWVTCNSIYSMYFFQLLTLFSFSLFSFLFYFNNFSFGTGWF